MPTRSPSAALCLLLALNALAEPPAPSSDGTIRGRVHDTEGAPMAGATVLLVPDGESAWSRERLGGTWIGPRVVQCDEKGAFVAERLPGSAFTVRVQAAGRAPFDAEKVTAGASLNVVLGPGRTIRGSVLASPGGSPISDGQVVACDVAARRFGPAACRTIDVSEDGTFALEHLPEVDVELRATAPRRAASDIRIVGVDESDAAVTLLLRPGSWLSGRVLDQEGDPIAGARVAPIPADGGPADPTASRWPEFTRDDGLFRLPGVEPGSVWIVAVRADRPSASLGPLRVERDTDRSDLLVSMPDEARLTMRLVDPDDRPVDEVEVYLNRSGELPPGSWGRPLDADRLEHGEEGRHTVRMLRPGSYDLHLVPGGYREVRQEGVVLRAGTVTDLATIVVDAGRTIEGRVAGSDGAPIADAMIEATYSEGGRLASRETSADENGLYRLGGLPEETARLVADAFGFVRSEPVEVDAARSDADFTLERAAALSGTVATEDGGVPDGFTISTYREVTADSRWFSSRSRQRAFSAADGSYRIDDLEPGRYSVEARAAGWAPGRVAGVDLLAGEVVAAAPIRLRRGATLRGRVVEGADETPLPAARIEVRERSGWLDPSSPAGGRATTDRAGGFEVTGLPAGSYLVRARHPDFAEVEKPVRIEDDGAEVVLAVTRGGTLTGTVRDRDGLASPGRALTIRADLVDEESSRRATTDAEGRYVVHHLRDGSYEVGLMPERGVDPRWKTAVVQESEVTVVDFDDESRIHLRGTVLNEEGPLGSATLYFAPLRSGIDLTDFHIATSDGDGRYEIELDTAGDYRVLVDSGGGFSGGGSTEIAVPDEAEAWLDIRLDRVGISGVVTGEEGDTLPGAAVTAQRDGVPAGLASLLVAETDPDGRYAIRGMEPGSYRVTAVAPGYRVGIRHPVDVGDDGDPTVDFRLERGGGLRGRVVTEDGRGIAGAVVFAAPAGSGESFAAANTETDVNGAFSMTAPADGPVDLAAFAAGHAPARLDGVLPVADPETDGLILRAGRGGRLRVRVVGEDGLPRAAVAVDVRAVPGFPGSAFARLLRPTLPTDAAGTTVAEYLSPGTYSVTVYDRMEVSRRVVVGDRVETTILVQAAE